MRPMAALAIAGLVGCADGGTGGAESEDPYVAILSPDDGDVVCGAPLAIEVEVRGIELIDPYDPPDPPPEGTGHLDVMLNGQDALMSDQTEFAVPDVDPGEWQLKVELSNADHTPLVPYAGDFLYVTVTEEACGS